MHVARETIQFWDFKGLVAATGIIGLWLALTGFLLLGVPPESIDWWAPVPVAVLIWLSTGLFITAHDAMHGTICPSYTRLNHAIGMIGLGVYALMPYRRLRTHHQDHHRYPASDQDPDYHRPGHANFWRWYLDFIGFYVTWWQVLGMAVLFNLLQHGVGISQVNLLVFWVVPVLLSTLQLFYFGTYLPHRGPHRPDDEHQTTSTPLPQWASFITCFHFGAWHRKHHEEPACPWWRLPKPTCNIVNNP